MKLSANDSPSASFPTTYEAILERIDQIDPVQYARSRNFIDGTVTYLSPYISRGVISVKQVHDLVLSRGYDASAIAKFLQELAWREYFQRVWEAKGHSMFADLRQPQTDVMHHHMIKSISDASTSIVAIDNAIIDLYNTGYMHNHLRMYVASIACNIAKAHWTAPSQWMYYHLFDGDLASNTCSWQWVAGAFSSKKYYANQANINLHTRTDQRHTFLDGSVEDIQSGPVPESLASTVDLSLQTKLPTVPQPVIDTTKPTLIYNAYNLDPQWRTHDDVNRILLLEPSHFEKFPVSEKVIAFIVALSVNIMNCQIMVGEVSVLKEQYHNAELGEKGLISKEHPAFTHYPGVKDTRDWLYPDVVGYYPSFSAFWKKLGKRIKRPSE